MMNRDSTRLHHPFDGHTHTSTGSKMCTYFECSELLLLEITLAVVFPVDVYVPNGPPPSVEVVEVDTFVLRTNTVLMCDRMLSTVNGMCGRTVSKTSVTFVPGRDSAGMTRQIDVPACVGREENG